MSKKYWLHNPHKGLQSKLETCQFICLLFTMLLHTYNMHSKYAIYGINYNKKVNSPSCLQAKNIANKTEK